MGEGWSNWYGTMLTIRDGDTGTNPRPIGNWLFGNEENGAGIIPIQTYNDAINRFFFACFSSKIITVAKAMLVIFDFNQSIKK